MPVRNGTGATLTMGTTDLGLEITSMSQGDMTVPTIDVTHLASTTAREFIPADLRDFGELTFDAHIDPDKLDTFDTAIGVAQTMTLTFPVVTGETVGATMAGSGIVTSGSFTIPLEDKITGSFTIKWAGDVTFTDAT